MMNPNLVQVALDQDLVRKLLDGLYNGAKGKTLKVVISTSGHYHINSKELRMILEVDADGQKVKRIAIHNEKQSARINAEELESMGLATLGAKVIVELKAKYSPYYHSLAENIVVFGRAYGG